MKRFFLMVMSLVLALSFVACTEEKKEPDFDAKGYVQSTLDARFHKEYADYAKGLGITEEQAKTQIETEYNTLWEKQIAQQGWVATQEQIARYQQMLCDIHRSLQYEVQTATKDAEANYTVDVAVTPIAVYHDWETITKQNVEAVAEVDLLPEVYMDELLKSLQYCIEHAEKQEPVTYTFHVTWQETDGNMVYTISDKEITEFEQVATAQK